MTPDAKKPTMGHCQKSAPGRNLGLVKILSRNTHPLPSSPNKHQRKIIVWIFCCCSVAAAAVVLLLTVCMYLRSWLPHNLSTYQKLAHIKYTECTRINTELVICTLVTNARMTEHAFFPPLTHTFYCVLLSSTLYVHTHTLYLLFSLLFLLGKIEKTSDVQSLRFC